MWLSRRDIEQFSNSSTSSRCIDHPEENASSIRAVEKYFVAQIEEHMGQPRDDLTSILEPELDGPKLALNTSSAHGG